MSHNSILVRAILTCMAAVLMGACSQDAATLFENAKARHAKGDRAGAIVQLKSAIQEDPRNPAMRYLLGQLYLEVRDGVSAEKELREAGELGMKGQAALAADLAEALWLQGNVPALMREVTVPEGANVTPQALVKIHVFRGRAQAYVGALAAAKESLSQARKAARDKPSPVVALLEADILSREGRATEAIALLDAVLKAQPRLYDALLLKADVLRSSGRMDETIATLNALLDIYPHDRNGLVARSSMLLQQGRWQLAEKDVEVLRKEHKGHAATHLQEGMLRFRKGQFRSALESFQATLKRNRNVDLARLYMGMSYLALGEAQQAERILSTYVTDFPGDQTARQMLAAALIELGEPARALDVIAPVLARADPGASFLSLAAEAHFRLGRLDKAEEFLSKATEKAGPGSIADEKRAITRLAAGEHDAALEDFARIAKARKGISNVDIALVLGVMRKDPDRAIALIDEMDKRAPRQPFLFNLKGAALLKKDDKQAAIAAFEQALAIQPSFLPAAANLFKIDIEQGKLAQARERFVAVLKADPKHYQALLALAEVEESTGKSAEAIALVKRAASAHPQQAEPHARLVSMHLRRGDKEAAMQVAQEFMNRNAASLIAHELMGKVQLSQGDTHGAIGTYTRLVTQYPKAERAHLALAEAQLQARRVPDAERSLRRILELNPDHREGQLAWVGLMVKEKRVDEARRYAQTLQKERATSPAGWVLEADIHWAQAKFADAAKALSNALAITPRDDFAIRRYEAQSRADDANNGLARLRQFVEQYPDAMAARIHLAGILLRSGEFAEAVKLSEPVAKSANANAIVLNNLAYAYYKLNDRRALSVAEQAHRAFPENPVILDTLGLILLRDGDPKRALDLLQKAVKKQPNHPEFRYHFAAALHKTGAKEQAKTELTQLLQKHKTFPEREEAVALLKAIGA